MKVISTKEAIDFLKNGKTIIFPTETSYGLGCDATNQEAVDKIFKIKGRRGDKPLLVVVPTVEMTRECLEWTPLLEMLVKKYWPGALTIVSKLKVKSEKLKVGELVNGVVGQDGTVAVRVTNAKVPRYLSQELGNPVVATSANLADLGDIYDSEELIKMYEGREFQPDGIVDAGVLPKNSPTTIVSVVDDKIEILRQGEIKINFEF